jgi:nucleoside-diphosphate-sugar epimerase
MRVLLTGGSGFAGGFMLGRLLEEGIAVRAPTRRPLLPHPLLERRTIADLGSADWADLCRGADAVVHAAAHAHDDRADPAKIFRINRDATDALAREAGRHGIRFVLLSSIRAQAGVSSVRPLREADDPEPDGPYGEAKLAAENAVAANCGDHVILRLAPLYGPGAKGNMAALMRIARSPWPIPLGGSDARRSLLSVATLADVVPALLREAADVRGLHLVADPEPLSVGEMIATLRAASGRPDGLFAVPAPILKVLFSIAGCGSLWKRIGEPSIVEGSGELRSRLARAFRPTREGLMEWERRRKAAASG